MDWQRIRQHWHQASRAVQKEWAKLGDDDLVVVAGRREHLRAIVQQRYGVGDAEAEAQLAAWERRVGDSWLP